MTNTKFFLNDECIAKTAELSGIADGLKEFAVPHLSVMNAQVGGLRTELNKTISETSSSLTAQVGEMSCDVTFKTGEMVSSISQADGRVTVGKRTLTSEDMPADVVQLSDFNKTTTGHRIEFKYDRSSKLLQLGLAKHFDATGAKD